MKKRGPQIGELDQLKLKTVVLDDDHDGGIHMTHPIGFVATYLFSVVD